MNGDVPRTCILWSRNITHVCFTALGVKFSVFLFAAVTGSYIVTASYDGTAKVRACTLNCHATKSYDTSYDTVLHCVYRVLVNTNGEHVQHAHVHPRVGE